MRGELARRWSDRHDGSDPDAILLQAHGRMNKPLGIEPRIAPESTPFSMRRERTKKD
jgi:hypothetical protein